MNDSTERPAQRVAIYSDYICPFCFIGFLRLEKLRAEHDIDVDWRFLEIHPDNPTEGRPVTELGYPQAHWEILMANLARMAEEEGVALPERTFTTNSRRALKLARAVREHQPAVFDTVNLELYEAYFLRRQNIGDPEVLQSLAEACGVERTIAERAWNDPHYDQVLDRNRDSAARLQITGTPSYVFGEQVYSGAIPLELLRRALEESIQGSQP